MTDHFASPRNFQTSMQDRRFAQAERVPPDMRSLLRRATARYHGQLDRSSLLAPLAADGLTLAQYGCAMIALLQTYRHIDDCLAAPPDTAAAASAALPPYRPRGPAIAHDLHAMGGTGAMAPHVGESLLLEKPGDLPTYLGMRYVIEGAHFGNRVIGRNLKAVFGLRAEAICTSFLASTGDDGAWSHVMQALAALASRQQAAAALHGARATFRYFAASLGAHDGGTGFRAG